MNNRIKIDNSSLLTTAQSMNWLDACQWLESQGQAYCIATVVAHMGSVPRDSGSKIVITETGQYDTLGGGNLEYQIIQHARKSLQKSGSSSQGLHTEIVRFALTADLAQCCGGAVQVLLEFINTQKPKVAIFGAGHVSQSLCSILSQLPCAVTVYDQRDDWLAECAGFGVKTESLRYEQLDEVKSTIESLKSNSLVVIMTHDHALDYAITQHALQRDVIPFVGLIGSKAKNERFRFRLAQDLSNKHHLERLTCPIGHPDIQGKLPMQVAVSIAAQLMQKFESLATPSEQHRLSSASDSLNKKQQQQWQAANDARKQIQAHIQEQTS
jgi:xanthine dehydrogenase accessory factor